MFRVLINKYATALTAALFLIAAVSGVLMFFHIGSGILTGMHEWIGILFVVAALFHLGRNWRAFAGYFRRRVIYVPAAVVLAITVALVAPGLIGGSAGPDTRRQIMAVTNAVASASIETVASVFGVSPDVLIGRLTDAGMKVTSTADTLEAIAAQSNVEPMTVVALLPSVTSE